ncbi:DUF1572 family protein [Muricauda sp. CAU 1633]|uniref:DUF1572 family protein n=1 Tax=Allomuricauda sp. CAU 1633 TaxID=2816036 RepID=UPI001A8D9164|nr:DUF1572 family protein [Muricauda sp. CAU 1633]MBO0323983.1 DUF1572 family protein [Muricauda sp. CAU 1633]
MNFQENYLSSVIFEFHRYKTMGDKTFVQLTDEDILWIHSATDNSIAIIVKHMAGNMLSRWTNFLIEDGEKPWREREIEFEATYTSKNEMLEAWEKGWNCLFDALEEMKTLDFDTKIKIRKEEHTLVEAVNRQLAHYSSHVGQIVLLGKMIKGSQWKSLSIPKGGSDAFNKRMFGKSHGPF